MTDSTHPSRRAVVTAFGAAAFVALPAWPATARAAEGATPAAANGPVRGSAAGGRAPDDRRARLPPGELHRLHGPERAAGDRRPRTAVQACRPLALCGSDPVGLDRGGPKVTVTKLLVTAADGWLEARAVVENHGDADFDGRLTSARSKAGSLLVLDAQVTGRAVRSTDFTAALRSASQDR